MRVALALLVCACSTMHTGAYLTDATARRAILEASLVNKSNEYSKLRLAHYATGSVFGDWDQLPIHNPRAEPIEAKELDAGVDPNVLSASAATFEIPKEASNGDETALRALGERAFFRYPVQATAYLATMTRSRAIADSYGLWIDDVRGVSGLMRTEEKKIAVTCATCHSGVRNGSVVIGVPSTRIDIGRAMVDAGEGKPAYLAWGPGRVDVTTTEGVEPVRIPDLRPTRFLSHLHHTASVKQNEVASLAVRLETLIITSLSEKERPPREVALGLALYLSSLDATLPPSHAPQTPAETHGANLFSAHCERCHASPGYTGAPVLLAEIGTDPTLTTSNQRGTGTYRVPSLRGVASRGMLLHDASLETVDQLLDPARTSSAYKGRLGQPVMGHRFGLDLSATERSDLALFVNGL